MGMGIFDAFASTKNGEMTADALNEKTKGDKGLLGKCFPSLFSLSIFFVYLRELFKNSFSSFPLFLSSLHFP